MAKTCDGWLTIRISDNLKHRLKEILPKFGFNSYSDFVRSCAEEYILRNSLESEGIYQNCKPPYLDPDIQNRFFFMLNTQFAYVVAARSDKQMLFLTEDLIASFHAETGITLLPVEVQMLLRKYYSCNYSPDLRKAYEQEILSRYTDYQTELPKQTDGELIK